MSNLYKSLNHPISDEEWAELQSLFSKDFSLKDLTDGKVRGLIKGLSKEEQAEVMRYLDEQ